MSERLNITEFRIFRDHLREACGLCFADDKCPRVAKVIGSRMSELGIGCFSEYQRMLTSSPGSRDELATLAALLTVGETHFFRNEDHWRALAECVLPWIRERNAATGQHRIRIWSAGCSTGEEAYTASIVLSRSLPDLARWSIEITGTDLSPAAIATAKRAVYTEHSFRGVPPEIKKEYFDPVEAGRYSPRADIRDMVRFQEMNLLDTTAMTQMCDVDVIFCRNVLIYFDASSSQRVMAHFHRSLRSDGYLFLGHAESTHGSSPGFASLNVCNTFIYTSVPCAARASSPINTSLRPDREPSIPAVPRDSTEARRPSREQRQRTADQTDKSKAVTRARVDASLRATTEADRTPEREAPASAQSVATPTVPSLDALRARAIEHLCAEENAQARKTFEEILRREPNDSECLLGMALLLAGSGSSEAALQCCERILQAQPMSAEAYWVMALVHEGLGEDAIAQRELEKAVYLDDGFSIAHFRLAGLYNRAQRQDAATREFNNALEALPDDDEQRVRLYSGGFSKEIVAQICERRLGIESATVQNASASALSASSQGSEGKRE